MKVIYITLLSLFVFINSTGCGTTSDIPPGAIGIFIKKGAAGTMGIYGTAPLKTAAYGTNPLHIPLGSKVVWKNNDNMTHSSTSDSAIWDTGLLTAGSVSAIVTFDTPGTFPYHCAVHGPTFMSGTIVVP